MEHIDRRSCLPIAVVLVAAFAVVLFSSCEDHLTPDLQEQVRLAALPDRSLFIEPPGDGSAVPVGEVTVKDGEPTTITATANSGFHFYWWEKVSGEGEVEFADRYASPTEVTLTGGDATIMARIEGQPLDLTFVATAGGVVVNSEDEVVSGQTIEVPQGYPYLVTAIPDVTYVFDGWSQLSSPGTAEIGNEDFESTTVTISNDAVTVQAAFRKANVTLTMRDVGQLSSPSPSPTTPDVVTTVEDLRTVVIDMVAIGDYAYVVGEGGGTNAALRRWNISDPDDPYTGPNDYDFLYGTEPPTGIAIGIEGLFIGTGSGVGSLERRSLIPGNFGPGMDVTSSTMWVRALGTEYGNGYIWSSRNPGDIWISGNKGDVQMWSESLGRFDSVLDAGNGIVAVHRQDDHGDPVYELWSFVPPLGGGAFTRVADEITLVDGGTPRWVGKPVASRDFDFIYIPLQIGSSAQLRVVDSSSLGRLEQTDSLVMNRHLHAVAVDRTGEMDGYVFGVGGSISEDARVYVFDVYDPENVTEAAHIDVTDGALNQYDMAYAIAASGNLLYVVLSSPPTSTNQTDVALGVFEVALD